MRRITLATVFMRSRTPRVRAEAPSSERSTLTLSSRCCLNAQTVANWRKRTTTADLPMGQAAEEHGA